MGGPRGLKGCVCSNHAILGRTFERGFKVCCYSSPFVFSGFHLGWYRFDLFVRYSDLLFFSSKPLRWFLFLLPIWVPSSVRQNEAGKSHYWLLLSEQLWLNKFLSDRGGPLASSTASLGLMLHYIQILFYCGEHKCSGFNALLGPFTLTVHSLRITPLLLLSPSVLSSAFCLPPSLLISVSFPSPINGLHK